MVIVLPYNTNRGLSIESQKALCSVLTSYPTQIWIHNSSVTISCLENLVGFVYHLTSTCTFTHIKTSVQVWKAIVDMPLLVPSWQIAGNWKLASRSVFFYIFIVQTSSKTSGLPNRIYRRDLKVAWNISLAMCYFVPQLHSARKE